MHKSEIIRHYSLKGYTMGTNQGRTFWNNTFEQNKEKYIMKIWSSFKLRNENNINNFGGVACDIGFIDLFIILSDSGPVEQTKTS